MSEAEKRKKVIPMTDIEYAPDYEEVLNASMVYKYRQEIKRLADEMSGDAHILYDRLLTHFLHHVKYIGDGGEAQGLAGQILKIEDEIDIKFWYD